MEESGKKEIEKSSCAGIVGAIRLRTRWSLIINDIKKLISKA